MTCSVVPSWLAYNCPFTPLFRPYHCAGVAAALFGSQGRMLYHLMVVQAYHKERVTSLQLLLSGVLSHCFDGSLLGKKCPKCSGDRIGAFQERPMSMARVDAPQSSGLVTSEDLLAQGDHEFDVDRLTASA
eukprot:scaffold5521_cov358-Prasinococcus_capsulatus_cf.AAC.1